MKKKLTEVLRDQLALDILDVASIYNDQAKAVVAFLVQEGLVDYETLKEYYLDEEL